VNYNGNHPYKGGREGIYRNETVDVKALPCNDWGLYQMHGNVSEWCADWYGEYEPGEAIGPAGPEGGGYRVIRGGCWLNFGRNCRSACRDRESPDNHSYNIGFRMAGDIIVVES
jgi:formylglycine-generating enzyme required for sulfatase activity